MSALTPEQQVRLEVMKIAHRPDKDVQTNIDRMSELEKFVLVGNQPKDNAEPAPVVEEEKQQEQPEPSAEKPSARKSRQG